MRKHLNILQATVWTSFLLVTGCVNPGKNMMPQDTGPTMAQIYNKQTGVQTNNESGDPSTPLPASPLQITSVQEYQVTNADYTMSTQNQVNQVFKILPNPAIAVYIFPHMTQFNHTDVPVPGYTTSFFLYEKNHYAMPGEIY